MKRQAKAIVAISALVLLTLGAGAITAFASPPEAVTGAPGDVTGSSATLHGYVDPQGGPASECRFEYGTEESYGQAVPCEQPGPYTEFIEVSAPLSGLELGTTYHFRLVGSNVDGDSFGEDRTFTTSAKPAISEDFASALSTEATLNATIDPSGLPTTYHFEFGTDTSYGTSFPVGEIAEPTVGIGDTHQNTTTITNVSATQGAFEIGQTIAVQGLVRNTKVTGTGPGTLTVSNAANPGLEGTPLTVVYPRRQSIQGLQPATTYHFRLVAENANGTTVGPDRTFWTQNPLAPTGADSCANAAVRAQQGAQALPECRAYEQVSPTDKNSSDVVAFIQMSEDGEGVAWISLGSYGDPRGPGGSSVAPYVGRRDGGDWKTTDMSPAVGAYRPGTQGRFGGYTFSGDLSSYAVVTKANYDPADDDLLFGVLPSEDIYRIGPDRQARLASHNVFGPLTNEPKSTKLWGSSADGSSDFFSTEEKLDPNAPDGVESLYRNRNGQVELVSRDEGGAALLDGATLGSGGDNFVGEGSPVVGTLSEANAISRDGKAFVYTAGGPGLSRSEPSVHRVYLHEANGTVRALGRSQRSGEEGTLHGVIFLGASGDLTHIVLSSKDQLTDDAPAGGGFYLYEVGEKTLTYIGPDDAYGSPSGEILGAFGIVKVSADGGHVYFVSTFALAPGASEGDPNLYAWTETGTRFVATLDREDIEVAPGLRMVIPTRTAASLSEDGSKLVFQSRGNPTGEEPFGYTQVYLYDYASDRTVCLSCGRTTGAADESFITAGGIPGYAVIPQPRTISADGTRAVFTSLQRLSPLDANTALDAYEWVSAGSGECSPVSSTYNPDSGGCVYLLSSGNSSARSRQLGISADGKNIYIETRSSLAPSDTDHELNDIYDVRAGGGSLTLPPAAPCAGDACQEKAEAPPAAPAIATAEPSGDGKVRGRAARKPCRATKRRPPAKHRRAKRAKASCAKHSRGARGSHGRKGGSR